MIDKAEVYKPCVYTKIYMAGVRSVLNEQLDLVIGDYNFYEEDGGNGLPDEFYAGYLDAINVAISQLEDAYKHHILELEQLVNFTLQEKMGLGSKGESDG